MKSSTRFVMDMFNKNKKQLYKIILVATLGALFTVATPYIYGKLFGLSMTSGTATSLLLGLIILWLILNLLSNFISSMTGYMGEVIGVKMSQESEADAYSHFLTLPILFHKREQRGEILQKISRASWSIQDMISTISDVLPQFLMLLFSMVAMFIIKWQLAMFLLVAFLIYGFFTIKFVKPEMEARKKEHKAYEKQYGAVYDKLYNVFLVKNFVMEDEEKERFFKSLVEKIVPIVKDASAKSRKVSIVQGIITGISFVAVLGGAIFFLRAGQITPSEFVMFFGYINLTFSPLGFFGSLYRKYKRVVVAIRRFLKLRSITPEKMTHGNKTLSNFSGEIILENIDFGYLKEKKVLKGINLDINPGETIALVGKSGVGKTTLAELVMGYYLPNKGKIKLDGTDISELQLKWIRDQIAIVPQDLNLFNDTLINNLRYANQKATEKQVIDACKAASADEFIRMLPKGYHTKVGEEGVKLSMGQRQRIAIAMAFLKNPKILILDEPTAALDAESERKVQEGINKLVKGKTTLIIAHRFSTVRNADKIVVLEKGRIAELGNHEELMKKKGIYYNLYKLQRGLD